MRLQPIDWNVAVVWGDFDINR